MNKTLIRKVALFALMVPGLAAAESLSDTTPYVVDPVDEPERVYLQNQDINDYTPWKTTVVKFIGGYYGYTAQQEDSVVTDEHRITGGTLGYDWTGDPAIDFLQARIPEATNSDAPAATQTQPTSQTATVFQKTFNRNEKFGNSKIVAAGYNINASITATTATSTAAKKVEALGEGRVFGQAFGFEREIVRGRAYVHGQQGGTTGGNASVFVMGNQIANYNLYASFDTGNLSWSRTFFNASKTFWVGPVPANVRLNVTGGAKLRVFGEISPVVARLTAQPGAWADLSGSASASIIVAGIGVSVSMKLVDATLPSMGELIWPFCTLDWKLTSNLVLTNTLGGTITAWAKVRMIFFSKTWRVTIAQWAGINRNWSLLNIVGSLNLGLC